MLPFLQNPLTPLSFSLSKPLNPPPITTPPLLPFPVTAPLRNKCLCQPNSSFPPLAHSSASQYHAAANPNPNSKPLNSPQNPKKNNENNPIPETDTSHSHKYLSNHTEQIPGVKPPKLQRQRGRPSKAQAAKNRIYNQLEQTLASIHADNPEIILKERPKDPNSDSECNEDNSEESELQEGAKKELIEEEDQEWPLDEEAGWGIRASDFFEKYPIKNVVENGVEIDWEGELDEGWVKEINCLEWESFAFHPSPLVVLVFQRYKRATDNWRYLKELETAAKVFWTCKDRLPPRTVKIDVNIERDLAYALQVAESDCPQILFFRGNRILYREKEIRCADELVQMIAHFYYNAKRPKWIDPSGVSS